MRTLGKGTADFKKGVPFDGTFDGLTIHLAADGTWQIF